MDTPTTSTPADPRVWHTRAVKRDLRATARLHLAMIGVGLSDRQTADLVDALLARMDGEWQVRQLQTPGSIRVPGS